MTKNLIKVFMGRNTMSKENVEPPPWAVLWRHRLSSLCLSRRGRLLHIIGFRRRKAVTIADIQGFLGCET